MDGGQARLQPVRPTNGAWQRFERERLGDGRVVPPRTVLQFEGDQLAVDDACVPAGMLQEHQREQAACLVGLRQELDEQAAEADASTASASAAVA